MRRLWIAFALAAAAAVALPGAALAQEGARRETALVLAGPEDVPLGDPARLIAVLREVDGAPIPGARIELTSPAEFAGVVGEMALGEVVTDAAGRAVFDTQLRIQGRNRYVARFAGDAAHRPAEAAIIVVATGTAQLAYRDPGVRFPVPVEWLVIAALAAVWSVYFTAVRLVTGIPDRAGGPA